MSYAEHRVHVADFGVLPADSDLLIPVPSVAGARCFLHTLAASAYFRMSAAVAADLRLPLLAASGWRAHRWASRAAYEAAMIERYGSVAEGQRWIAFNSPHETGLAVDIGFGGLTPDRKTAAAQRETPLWHWLHDHAWEYGWTPYMAEPWHWEHWVTREAWLTGTGG